MRHDHRHTTSRTHTESHGPRKEHKDEDEHKATRSAEPRHPPPPPSSKTRGREKGETAERGATGRLSPREIVFANPDAARDALSAERDLNPLHRRAPTPHASRSRRRSSVSSVRSMESTWSARSKSTVITGSSESDDTETGTRRRHGSRGVSPLRIRIPSTDVSHRPSPASGLDNFDGWEPHFGSSRGIGSAGEAIEVIGLGRKEPRHRKFESRMLKPALRSSSRRGSESRSDSRLDLSLRPNLTLAAREKPLPHRPVSQFRASTINPTFVPPHVRTGSSTGLGGLFSTLSLSGGGASQPRQGVDSRFRGRSRRVLLEPADNLSQYLHTAQVLAWNQWPPTSGSGGSSGGFFGAKGRGFEHMPKEWLRRFEASELARMAGRALTQWTNASRVWDRDILDWCEENVPSQTIDPKNRWGNQIYALPAEGFDTLEFFDDTAMDAVDNGLLSWLTGTILQTATSTLHALRYSSQALSFHLIPPQSRYNLNHKHGHGHALLDGFGTLVLVNKTDDADRAMVIEVRPPSIVSNAVLREFARGRKEWWVHLPGETCIGDIGQANVLQAQVYDDCLQNQVYYFAVTNLKSWVFGRFSADWSQAVVGPVVERKQRDPSVMQCLATWIVRSADERPFASNQPSASDLVSSGRSRRAGDTPVPPYSQPSRTSYGRPHPYLHPRASLSHSQSHLSHTPHADSPSYTGMLPEQTPGYMYPPSRNQSQLGVGVGDTGMGDFRPGFTPGYFDQPMGVSMGSMGAHAGMSGYQQPLGYDGRYGTWGGMTSQQPWSSWYGGNWSWR